MIFLRYFGQKRVFIGITVAIILVIFITASVYRSNAQYQQIEDSIAHDDNVESTLSSLLFEIVAAESGQRGYIITDNSTYLQPYNATISSINGTLATLNQLVSSDSNLTIELGKLVQAVDAKLSELAETIQVRGTQGFAAAQAIVNTNVGELYSQKVQAIAAAMQARVISNQNEETGIANQQAALRLDFVYFYAVLVVGLIFFVLYSINQSLIEEKKSRNQAELLQDILTHDIRNYNQVSRLSAEYLVDRIKGNKGYEAASSRLIQGIDGSTQLVDKAQKLGRILSQGKPKLHPVDLIQSIDKSLLLVKKASPNKEIKESRKIIAKGNIPAPPKISVLADDLLDEVFVNLFSNAAKYTEGPRAQIEITIQEEDKSQWEIRVADHGRGIFKDQKDSIFSRYTSKKKGSGLGMSIVHALVVGRYGGKVWVEDNNLNSKSGTVIVIVLRKA